MFNLTRQEKIVVVFLAVCFLAGLAALSLKNLSIFKAHKEEDINAAVRAVSSAENIIAKVKISGAVLHPGIYEFKNGGTAMDVIDRAVPLVDADLDRLDTGLAITKDCSIEVPYKSGKDDKININSATAEELDKLPGIGPGLAKKIIESREKVPFNGIEDIKNVDGIGNKKFEAIKTKIKTR